MHDKELHGRVALVTGVSRRAGIGAAIASELADAGALIFLTYFRNYDRQQDWGIEAAEPEDLLHEIGTLTEVQALELDLSDPAAPKKVFELAIAAFGRVDILINNAAHWEAGGLDRVDGAMLDRHYAVNVRASLLLC